LIQTCSIKQTFAQCTIFLEETLTATVIKESIVMIFKYLKRAKLETNWTIFAGFFVQPFLVYQ